jgi:type VI secretion system protein ImpH
VSTAPQVRTRAKLEDMLRREGRGFEFAQAMRLLMKLYPDRGAIGGWEDPAREVVRLSVPPSFAFPPSEIAFLRLPDERDAEARGRLDASAEQVQMGVRFLGLIGPQGVLPHVYNEHAAARTRAKDTAFRDFLDIFHHRALSLFYRAWEYNRPTLAAERGQEDRMRAHLLDLVGAGTPGVQQRSTVPLDALAHYAGLLSLRTRPAEGLAQLVANYFEVPVEAEQFVGEWQPLLQGGQACLDAEGSDGCLGMGVIGDAVFDVLARVRLRLGPLTRPQFDAFLPGGASHSLLCALARLYADDQVGVEAQLVLRRDAIPGATLGEASAPTLGFGTWLRTKPPARDADDVRLILC